MIGEIEMLWKHGGYVISQLGRLTTADNEVQEILIALAEQWSTLGKALGVMTPEQAANLERLVTNMRRVNAEARELEKQ